MSHQSAILQIDALAAVGSDDCEILLHASHIQSVVQDVFKVVTMLPSAAQMMMKAVIFLLPVPISRKL
ncbi:MAG: hypothetical protein SOY73_13070 [Blautia sp.]|nr:hypothetical protein [Blautia sp.]